MVPGRLGMLLTLFLMLVNMSCSVSQTIPKSDSVCPLVAWIFLSIVFIICALLEYVAILLRLKFQGGFSRDSLKKLDIGKKEVKTEQWARALDLAFLTSLPPVYLLAVTVFVANLM